MHIYNFVWPTFSGSGKLGMGCKKRANKKARIFRSGLLFMKVV